MTRWYRIIALTTFFVASVTTGARAGLFDDLSQQFTAPDAGFLARSFAVGNDIFVTIFVAYIVIGLCKATLANNFDQFWWNIAAVVFKMIGPLAALNFAHLILPNIVGFVGYFVGAVTGYGTGAGGPDALVGLGLTTSIALVHAAAQPLAAPGGFLGALANPGNLGISLVNAVMAVLAAIVCYFAFVWVAIELVLAWYQVLFASAVGAASIGFFAAEATADMGFRYTSGVVAGIWKVIFLNIWPYTVSAVFLSFHFAADAAQAATFVQAIIGLIVFSLVVIVATTRISRMADQMFSGQASFSAREIVKLASDAASGAGRQLARRGA
jgi:hypothetical protein